MKFSTLLNNLQGNSDKKSTPSSSQSTSPIPPIQSISTSHHNNNFEYKTVRSSSIHPEVEDICCAICRESLSLRLAGEKAHVVPICGHKLHASCFTAVYGGLARAKQGNSLGVCGICRKDMKLGEEGAERKNKFAAMAGLPQAQDSNHPLSASQRPLSDIDKFSDSNEDDDLVQLPSIANLRLHNLYTLNGKASAETMRGSSSGSPRAGSPYQTGVNSSMDVVKPIITVRSEHPKVVRSSNKEEKQHLTCIISIELPSRYHYSEKERKEREWSLQKTNEQVDSELSYRTGGSASMKQSMFSTNSDSTYAGQPSSPTSSSFSSPSYRIGSNGTSATSPLSLSDNTLAPIVEDLHRRMEDWKGHSPSEFGQLKLCDYIFVRKESNVREFLVYLFDEAILCVTDDKRKGDGKRRDKIRLKGRVYVKHIRNVADTSKDGELSITVYMSDENLDEFVMTFQDKSRMEVWKSQIETLVTLHHLSPSQRLAAARSIITSTSMTGSLSADSNKSFNSDYSEASDEFGRSPSSSVSSYIRHGKPKDIPEENAYDMRHFNLSNAPESSKYSSSIASYPKTLSSTSSYVEKSPVSISSHLHPSSATSIHPLPSLHTSPNPRDFTPLDLMLVLALPSSSGSSTLKLRILKSSIYFILDTVGPRTRISLITYQAGEGNRGKLGRSNFIAVGTQEGRQKLEKLVGELGNEIIGEGGLYEHGEERVNVAAAVNVGLDIVLMRKTKSALTGMILMNDSTKDGTQKAQMDLVCARIESAQLPVHTIGWGNHDPSSLWLLSNHTSGTYSFVKEFYDLRDTLAGAVGSLLSIGITHLKLHISVPEKRWFRIRKVSGTQPGNTILSSEGIDVDIDIGELRFGEKRDLLIEVEMSLGTFGKSQKRDVNRGKQIDTATDATAAFFLSNTGVNPAALDDFQPSNFYEDQYDEMADTAPLYEINASYRDPAAGQTISRLSSSPILLTIVVEPPVTLGRTLLPAPPLTISAPEIVQRRMELLCSDMLTRTLLLMSRRNDTQAKKLLGETLRIISTINTSLSANHSSSGLSPAHLIARQTLLACSEDVQSVLVGCSDRTLFDTSTRSLCAELVVVLRDQRSWTARTPVERLYFNSDLSIWALERSKAYISP